MLEESSEVVLINEKHWGEQERTWTVALRSAESTAKRLYKSITGFDYLLVCWERHVGVWMSMMAQVVDEVVR